MPSTRTDFFFNKWKLRIQPVYFSSFVSCVYFMWWLTRVPDRNLWFALLQQMMLTNHWGPGYSQSVKYIPYLSVLFETPVSLALYAAAHCHVTRPGRWRWPVAQPRFWTGQREAGADSGVKTLASGGSESDKNKWLMCLSVAIFGGSVIWQQEIPIKKAIKRIMCHMCYPKKKKKDKLFNQCVHLDNENPFGFVTN